MGNTNNNLKICKDCRHFKDVGWFKCGKCCHPKNLETNVVYGDTFFKFYPSELRRSSFHCGSAGNWFEPKT